MLQKTLGPKLLSHTFFIPMVSLDLLCTIQIATYILYFSTDYNKRKALPKENDTAKTILFFFSSLEPKILINKSRQKEINVN